VVSAQRLDAEVRDRGEVTDGQGRGHDCSLDPPAEGESSPPEASHQTAKGRLTLP
jgi:hypothetical protein